MTAQRPDPAGGVTRMSIATAIPTARADDLTQSVRLGALGSSAVRSGAQVDIGSLRLCIRSDASPKEIERAVSQALDAAAGRRR